MAKTSSAYHCCVPLCTNDSRYDPKKELSFHRFPTDKKLRKQWLIKIRRDVGPKFKLSNATRVCSAHFLPEDLSRSLTGRATRKSDAVPSQFAWTKDAKPKRIGPQRRSRKTIAESTAVADSEGPPEVMPSTSMAASTEDTTTPSASWFHDYATPALSTEDKLEAAEKEIAELQEDLAKHRDRAFFLERFGSDPSLMNFYTGFKDFATLKAVFQSLKPTAVTMVRWSQIQRNSDQDKINRNSFRDESLSLIDQFFLFLCRIRQGFHEQDLAVRFGVSQATVSRILLTWANYLYVMLGSLQIWPSRTFIDANMPASFRDVYPKTRVIIDCTELKVQTPSSKVLNSMSYSSYKSHVTFKGLIGITPCGSVSFVSSLYTGAISDKEITSRSGLIDLLEAEDQVMADKGFLINDLLASKNASLVIPPFLGERGHFSKAEVEKTHEIARLRIHVERAIRRIKEYHILDGVIPLNLAPSVNQIWTVCAILTNFRGPLF